MSHVIRINELCHTNQCVVSHELTSHVMRMNELRHTNQCVLWHKSMCFVTQINESRHAHHWVVSHESMCLLTRIHESCHTNPWVMSYKSMRHVTCPFLIMSRTSLARTHPLVCMCTCPLSRTRVRARVPCARSRTCAHSLAPFLARSCAIPDSFAHCCPLSLSYSLSISLSLVSHVTSLLRHVAFKRVTSYV